MSCYIALLRGINVGGNRLVPMAELREMASALGFDNPRTLLQSGNLIFQTTKETSAELESVLELETEKRFGFFVDFAVRSLAEWQEIVAANPFLEMAASDPSHLVAMVLNESRSERNLDELDKFCAAGERYSLKERTLYLAYPSGIGTSKLTNAALERVLKCKGTARNWNTVLKISGMLAAR